MRKVMVFDDLDPRVPASETMAFAIDGEAFVIDVSAANAEAFREAVAPYREAAQRLGKHKIPSGKTATNGQKASTAGAAQPPTPSAPAAEWYRSEAGESGAVTAKKKEYRTRVRQWAAEHSDYEVGVRGVIPREVFQGYEKWCAKNKVPCGPESVGLAG